MNRDAFKAIADPTRRAILVLIAAGIITPNAIAEHFGTSRQAVSKHIKILTECRIVEQRKAGREVHYQLNPSKMDEIEKWIGQFKAIWEGRFKQLDELLSNLKSKENEK